jgi:NADPH:quinone reductase
MRAIGVMTFGGPEALQVVELPVPDPGPGEVRLRVHAAAVNPTDQYTAVAMHHHHTMGRVHSRLSATTRGLR